MGLFDRFRGAGAQRPVLAEPSELSADDQAIARYRYMLRTAPPETIEQAHAQAFAQLTPEQRRRVLDELSREMPDAERAAALRAGDAPDALARAATRAEIRQPGVMERIFGGLGGAPGVGGSPLGGAFAGSFLASMAGTVVGSMIAQHFFAMHADGANPFAGAMHGAPDTPSHGGGAFTEAGDTFDDSGDVSSDFDDGGSFDV